MTSKYLELCVGQELYLQVIRPKLVDVKVVGKIQDEDDEEDDETNTDKKGITSYNFFRFQRQEKERQKIKTRYGIKKRNYWSHEKRRLNEIIVIKRKD